MNPTEAERRLVLVWDSMKAGWTTGATNVQDMLILADLVEEANLPILARQIRAGYGPLPAGWNATTHMFVRQDALYHTMKTVGQLRQQILQYNRRAQHLFLAATSLPVPPEAFKLPPGVGDVNSPFSQLKSSFANASGTGLSLPGDDFQVPLPRPINPLAPAVGNLRNQSAAMLARLRESIAAEALAEQRQAALRQGLPTDQNLFSRSGRTLAAQARLQAAVAAERAAEAQTPSGFNLAAEGLARAARARELSAIRRDAARLPGGPFPAPFNANFPRFLQQPTPSSLLARLETLARNPPAPVTQVVVNNSQLRTINVDRPANAAVRLGRGSLSGGAAVDNAVIFRGPTIGVRVNGVVYNSFATSGASHSRMLVNQFGTDQIIHTRIVYGTNGEIRLETPPITPVRMQLAQSRPITPVSPPPTGLPPNLRPLPQGPQPLPPLEPFEQTIARVARQQGMSQRSLINRPALIMRTGAAVVRNVTVDAANVVRQSVVNMTGDIARAGQSGLGQGLLLAMVAEAGELVARQVLNPTARQFVRDVTNPVGATLDTLAGARQVVPGVTIGGQGGGGWYTRTLRRLDSQLPYTLQTSPSPRPMGFPQLIPAVGPRYEPLTEADAFAIMRATAAQEAMEAPGPVLPGVVRPLRQAFVPMSPSGIIELQELPPVLSEREQIIRRFRTIRLRNAFPSLP